MATHHLSPNLEVVMGAKHFLELAVLP